MAEWAPPPGQEVKATRFDCAQADPTASMNGNIEGEHGRLWFRRAEVDAPTRRVQPLKCPKVEPMVSGSVSGLR